MVNRTNSKLKLSIILLATCLTSVTFAAGDSTACNPKWALQFAISSNFTLSSFSGSNFSVERQLKENRAIRLGITLSESVTNTDSENRTTGESLFLSNNFNIKITSQYLFYYGSVHYIKPYFGIGPYCGMTIIYDKSEDGKHLTKKIKISQSFLIGANSSLGAEILLNKKISLLAEYGTSLGYTYSLSENTSQARSSVDAHYTIISQTKSYQNKFTIQNNSVLFGISVHF
ncbi:MAG: hypothetical protein PHW79_06755 [Candidatus Marinimicrobia bacterium]|nr:hypothetical protein [Candidatus Neomarinimicrobiota bacterium]